MVKYVPVDKAPKPSRRAEIVVTETGARIVLNMVFTVPEEMLKNVPQP